MGIAWRTSDTHWTNGTLGKDYANAYIDHEARVSFKPKAMGDGSSPDSSRSAAGS